MNLLIFCGIKVWRRYCSVCCWSVGQRNMCRYLDSNPTSLTFHQYLINPPHSPSLHTPLWSDMMFSFNLNTRLKCYGLSQILAVILPFLSTSMTPPSPIPPLWSGMMVSYLNTWLNKVWSFTNSVNECHHYSNSIHQLYIPLPHKLWFYLGILPEKK